MGRIPDAPASIGEFGWKMMLWENLNLNLALNHNLRGIKIKITIKIKKKATTPFPTNQVVCMGVKKSCAWRVYAFEPVRNLPLRSPVGEPSAMVSAPLTQTFRIPEAVLWGAANVALSLSRSGSSRTMSAK